MVLYDVKLIHPQTNEVIYHSVNQRVQMPPEDLFKKFPGAKLIITTTSALTQEESRKVS